MYHVLYGMLSFAISISLVSVHWEMIKTFGNRAIFVQITIVNIKLIDLFFLFLKLNSPQRDVLILLPILLTKLIFGPWLMLEMIDRNATLHLTMMLILY